MPVLLATCAFLCRELAKVVVTNNPSTGRVEFAVLDETSVADHYGRERGVLPDTLCPVQDGE